MYCDPGANLQGINHAQFMGIWLFGILDISYLKLWIARVTLLSNEVLSIWCALRYLVQQGTLKNGR